jgi:tetratricopeptide (TPR) repeat protein
MRLNYPLLASLLILPLFSLAQKPKTNTDSLARLDSVRTYMLQGSLLAMNAMQAKIDAERTGDNGKLNLQKAGESQNLFVQSRYYYRKAIAFDSMYYSGWSNLGTTYYFEGLVKTSIPFFHKSVLINDHYAQGWYNLGKAYDKTGKRDSAVYSLHRCIASDSNYLAGYVELSRIFFVGKDTTAAFGLLRTACAKQPNAELPWTTMAVDYFALNDSARGIAALEKAAAIFPDNIDRLDLLAGYFSRHNDPAKAANYAKLAATQRKQQEIPEEK